MDLSSAIDPHTIQAYRQTEYRVFGPLPALLQVDQACPALKLLHERYRTHCSAFITACNPQGAMLAATINVQRQRQLLQELSHQGLVAIAGMGQHPLNDWPGEPSFLVPGLDRAAAQSLGRHFEQNAIIWSGADAVPELILLR